MSGARPAASNVPGGVAPSGLLIATVLLGAILAISVGSIFARLAEAPGGVVAFWRMAFATLLIAPAGMRALRAAPFPRASVAPTLVAGVLLAAHFGTWLTSLSYTTVAASVALVSTFPIWVALFRWIGGVPPTRGVLIGLAVAVGGGVAVGFGDLKGGGGSAPLLGNGLALIGAMTVAGYFLAGRRAQRAGLSIHAYSFAVSAVATLALAPLPALLGAPYFAWPAWTWVWLIGIALAPQLLGHGGLNWGARWVDPTVVATVALLEPVGAGLLAWWLFAEVPGATVLAGAPVMLAGVAMVVRYRRREGSPAPPGSAASVGPRLGAER